MTTDTQTDPRTRSEALGQIQSAPTTEAVDRTVKHGTFILERTYPASRQSVFEAWSNRDAKNAWFGEGDDFLSRTDTYTLDFQVGGRELLEGILPDGRHFEYDSTYGDIVDGRRLVTTYAVAIEGRRTSVSLMTVEFQDDPAGTHLIVTEQGAFFSGSNDSNELRIQGASESLDQLGRYLAAHG